MEWQDEICKQFDLIAEFKTLIASNIVYTFYEYRDKKGRLWCYKLVGHMNAPKKRPLDS